jgi:hypothetical protein
MAETPKGWFVPDTMTANIETVGTELAMIRFGRY